MNMSADSRFMNLLSSHTHAIILWPQVVSSVWHQKLPVHPLVPRNYESDARMMPVLLKLDEAGSNLLKQICGNLEEAVESPSMHLLSCLLNVPSETSTSSLVFHLTDKLMLNGFKPKGHKFILYYFRSKAFLLMQRVLAPEQMRQLFGPIETWTVLFQNEWTAFMPPETTRIIPELWMASDEQLQRIQHIGLINQVLDQQIEETNQRWASLDDFYAAAEKVEQTLAFAVQRYHMLDYDDIILFAGHAMKYGKDFHRHPNIRGLLRIVEQQGWGYAQESMSLTEEDWKNIAALRPASH